MIQGLNVVGLRRAGVAAPARDAIKRAYRLLYREGLSLPKALQAIGAGDVPPDVRALIEFVSASKRGIAFGLASDDGEEDAPPDARHAETLLPKTRKARNG